MADSRGVRSASRRKTPTPQPPAKTNTPHPGRATRRGMRSASRDTEPIFEVQKPTRRSARQASVATVTDSENEGQATRRTKRRSAKDVVADLTIVEEVDTQIDLEDVPNTPKHSQLEESVPFRSPGAASQMSGTTAISSFSMIEAEFLEPKFILKHLRKLCDSSREFLDHLAPEDGDIPDDLRNIQEMQKPDSEYNADYRDFEDELNVHLKYYKSEEHSYIHVRAIHRTLFDEGHDAAATQTGIDLILYLTNMLIFAKQMIYSDRTGKGMWDALRQLDNAFPSQFMSSLEPNTQTTIAGESKMLQETFELALELRTQLAILVLERAALDGSFDPDAVLEEVFFRSESSQETGTSIYRGWNVDALGGEDSALPPQFEDAVTNRLLEIRESFLEDAKSLARGHVVNFEQLSNTFAWAPTIMRLLNWVRLRHKELSTKIDKIGGAAAILRNVKEELQAPTTTTTTERPVAKPALLGSPRKKRMSFGRDRRRSSRKFDPNAPVDLSAIDALKARESRLSGASTAVPTQEDFPIQHVIEAEQDELPTVEEQQDQYQPKVIEEEGSADKQLDMAAEEQVVAAQTREEQVEQEPEEEPGKGVGGEEQEANPKFAGPPTSSAAMLELLKKAKKPEKENRASIFERQTGAQRVEFGDGFETQPTPGPSTRDKGKQRAQPPPSRKRPRPVEFESEEEEDAFESEDRSARVQERRLQAPVAKKVRIDPASSAAPPSHQPQAQREADDDYVPRPNVEESVSENEAPDMTEEAPPSTYQAQRRLAKQNIALPQFARTDRKPRTDWTPREEDAFASYMALYPAKYAAILRHDEDIGHRVLQDRTQVNLKDKARTMAINMIKSGTGLMTGFENIINPNSKHGQALLEQGYDW